MPALREPALQGTIIVGFRHDPFPEPRLTELAIALSRSAPSPVAVFFAIAGPGIAGFLIGPAVAVVVAVAIVAMAVALRAARSGLVGRWRRDRARRRQLNGVEECEIRRQGLVKRLADITVAADCAWQAYLADARTGRLHSVLHDRTPPSLAPTDALAMIEEAAACFGIVFMRRPRLGPPPPLSVPARAEFEDDILSPTFANLTAASLLHAREEGPRRAARRHRRAVADAARLAPLFAEAAEAASCLKGEDRASKDFDLDHIARHRPMKPESATDRY